MLPDGVPEQPLAPGAAHLPMTRHCRGEFHELVIEVRHAGFYRHGHAHAIDLREYVVREPWLEVDVHQRRRHVSSGGARNQVTDERLDELGAPRGTCFDQHPAALRGREVANPVEMLALEGLIVDERPDVSERPRGRPRQRSP